MKIVIDIPKDVYTRLFDNGIQDNEIAVDDVCEMARALRLGTPLPKHHGDLIDRRELKKEVYTTTEWNGDIHRIIYEASIDDAKPIIEGSDSE